MQMIIKMRDVCFVWAVELGGENVKRRSKEGMSITLRVSIACAPTKKNLSISTGALHCVNFEQSRSLGQTHLLDVDTSSKRPAVTSPSIFQPPCRP